MENKKIEEILTQIKVLENELIEEFKKKRRSFFIKLKMKKQNLNKKLSLRVNQKL